MTFDDDLGPRSWITGAALTLGSIMVIAGLLSLLTPMPRPELATAGATLMVATGLIGNRKS